MKHMLTPVLVLDDAYSFLMWRSIHLGLHNSNKNTLTYRMVLCVNSIVFYRYIPIPDE